MPSWEEWSVARAGLVARAAEACPQEACPPAAWLPPLPWLQLVKESPPWAVDAWGLGCLLQELYSGAPLQVGLQHARAAVVAGWHASLWLRMSLGLPTPQHPSRLFGAASHSPPPFAPTQPLPSPSPPPAPPPPTPLQRTEDLRRTDWMPQELLPHYQRLLSSQPARRLNPAKLLESDVLRNRLVETMGFLENLAIKDAAEKVGGRGEGSPVLRVVGRVGVGGGAGGFPGEPGHQGCSGVGGGVGGMETVLCVVGRVGRGGGSGWGRGGASGWGRGGTSGWGWGGASGRTQVGLESGDAGARPHFSVHEWARTVARCTLAAGLAGELGVGSCLSRTAAPGCRTPSSSGCPPCSSPSPSRWPSTSCCRCWQGLWSLAARPPWR